MSKIFILLCSTFWLALAPLAGLQAAAAPDLSGAKETDPRLHADGKGWRLDQARITNPKRPRVLLIGDSILGGQPRRDTGERQLQALESCLKKLTTAQETARTTKFQ